MNTPLSQPSAFSLAGKVALVTGAGQGIGAATAQALAAAGAAVMVTDLRGPGAQDTAASIRHARGRAHGLTHDVTDEAQWQAAVQATLDTFGRLDILVNNAGIELVQPLLDTPLAAFRHIQQTNVESVFLGMQAAVRVMRPGGACGRGGAVVNLSSGAGLKATPLLAAYSASKGAVRAITKTAAIEFAKLGYGVRVNSIHPAVVDTRMGRDALQAMGKQLGIADPAALQALLVAMQPLGLGQPQDVAQGVVYLASDAARWVTGIELVIDGGWLAN